MAKKVLIFIICTLFNSSILFANTECHPKLTELDIVNMTESLMVQHFQGLLDHKRKGLLKTRFFKGNEYFLKANFKISHTFKRKKKRKLILSVSSNLLNCPPSINGLEAILIHELFHLQDYLKATSKTLMKIGSKYTTRRSRARYERYTDLRSMKKNYANGLIEYREWLYKRLNKKQLKKKKILYYTPEEIINWLTKN